MCLLRAEPMVHISERAPDLKEHPFGQGDVHSLNGRYCHPGRKTGATPDANISGDFPTTNQTEVNYTSKKVIIFYELTPDAEKKDEQTGPRDVYIDRQAYLYRHFWMVMKKSPSKTSSPPRRPPPTHKARSIKRVPAVCVKWMQGATVPAKAPLPRAHKPTHWAPPRQYGGLAWGRTGGAYSAPTRSSPQAPPLPNLSQMSDSRYAF
jgi:hypothetical protein